MRMGGDGGISGGPRIALERLRRDAHAQIALAVQPLVPRRDDAVRIHHRIVAVVVRLAARRRALGICAAQDEQADLEDASFLHKTVDAISAPAPSTETGKQPPLPQSPINGLRPLAV